MGSLKVPDDIVHASCVALNGRGVLIMGASGSGKSALALKLMSLGSQLVADDQTHLHVANGALIATCPTPIRGMIEARGVGLLAAETSPSAPIELAIDMNRVETARLPEFRTLRILSCAITLIHKVEHDHFPAAVLQYLKCGRRA